MTTNASSVSGSATQTLKAGACEGSGLSVKQNAFQTPSGASINTGAQPRLEKVELTFLNNANAECVSWLVIERGE